MKYISKIYGLKIRDIFTSVLAKLGTDGFSLVLFGTKVADSNEFCKKFITLIS
jgi:hypothetical protein